MGRHEKIAQAYTAILVLLRSIVLPFLIDFDQYDHMEKQIWLQWAAQPFTTNRIFTGQHWVSTAQALGQQAIHRNQSGVCGIPEREHLAWPTAEGVQTLGGNSSAHSALCAKTGQGQGTGPCAVPGSHRLFQNRKDSGLDLEDGGLRLKFAHLCYLQAVNHQDISPVGTAPLSYQSFVSG